MDDPFKMDMEINTICKIWKATLVMNCSEQQATLSYEVTYKK